MSGDQPLEPDTAQRYPGRTAPPIRPLVSRLVLAAGPNPDVHKITAAGNALSAHLSARRAPRSLPGPIVIAR
ncbi:hypothetical protein [Streptomyces phaeolivaceus]|uniref:hypothetical protein n=1 Tax=Streptomyces phaeolivaceus TaxID=2653200 RepID=UPI001D03F22D|nr:hypothetical protein [Streptomyces phaeolivaceus]